ncbi:MAG: hypothetical protein HY699_06725 [Deltaproteobacteria bacterium]|nr:hypothetical protein [Deltaproteobacteria bacterium]
MRVLKRNPWLTGLGTVLSLLGLWWGSARADATTDQTGSVLFFPKVIADGTRDTLIQITNTRPDTVLVHCEYINASGRCRLTNGVCSLDSDCGLNLCVGGTCSVAGGVCATSADCTANTCDNILWNMLDFGFGLTRQQPTIWRVSTGRDASLTGPPTPPVECVPNGPSQICPGQFSGDVPLAPAQPFRGQLVCYEVDSSLNPLGQNALKGEAVIQTLGTDQISEYNAIGVRAIEPIVTDKLISMNNEEYNACPEVQYFNHYAQGADDLVAENNGCPAGACPVSTELTMVPCTADFENLIPATVTAQFRITNEFEQSFSASRPFTCWFNGRLDQISANFSAANLGSTFAQTRIRTAYGRRCADTGTLCNSDADCSAAGLCLAQSGILAVSEAFHSNLDVGTVGTDAANTHFVGNRARCIEPSDSGQCANASDVAPCFTGLGCISDGDCDPGQFCATDSILGVTP